MAMNCKFEIRDPESTYCKNWNTYTTLARLPVRTVKARHLTKKQAEVLTALVEVTRGNPEEETTRWDIIAKVETSHRGLSLVLNNLRELGYASGYYYKWKLGPRFDPQYGQLST